MMENVSWMLCKRHHSLTLTGFNFLYQMEVIVNENTLSQCPEMLKDGDIKRTKIPYLMLFGGLV